jgi:Protein of unknown function (DUF3616)
MPVSDVSRSSRAHNLNGRPRLRKRVALLLSALMAASAAVMAAPPAHAEGTDIVSIPDANLKAAINKALSRSDLTSDITVTDAASLTRVSMTSATGPVSDLTGVEALTNVTRFEMPCVKSGLTCNSDRTYNSVTDLSPLLGMTNLTWLQIASTPAASLPDVSALTKLERLDVYATDITDLSPLSSLGALKSLTVRYTDISDVSPLAGLAGLTTLNMSNNQIRNLVRFAPNLTFLNLSYNMIVDVSPLAATYNTQPFETVDLTHNRISDPSPIAEAWANGIIVTKPTSLQTGLKIGYNRIKDFSSFASGWNLPATTDQFTRGTYQDVYVGAYQNGGVTVGLKSATSAQDWSLITPGASYDPSTQVLTVDDPSTTTSVTFKGYQWIVHFTDAPYDPLDDTGATVGDGNGNELTTNPKIGDILTVANKGSLFTSSPCTASGADDPYSYQWLRDGKAISGNTNFGTFSDTEADVNGGTDQTGFTSDRWLGGPGRNASYVVSATDVGHTLSLQLTCTADGRLTTTADTALAEAPESEAPVIQTLTDTTVYDATPHMLHRLTGVVGDPTNPSLPIYVGQLSSGNTLVDPAQLTVAATVSVAVSSGQPAPALSDITISGTGAERTVSVNPTQVYGDSLITVTVTGTSGKTATLRFTYQASIATTPTSRVMLGTSDASTAISTDDGYLMVADDEDDLIRLYDSTTSSRPVNQFLPYSGNHSGEIDFEAAARKGDKIYWLGSHSNKKDGSIESSRQAVFRTTVSGSGATAKLTADGSYLNNASHDGLRIDMARWDAENGDRLNLTQATKKGSPTALGGFDIEAAEFSPDQKSLYLGMRSPVSPAVVGGKAVIVPVTNIDAVIDGTDAHAAFADPILLNLGGDSIRELRRNDRNEYLILSAKAPDSSDAGTQHLWAWDGQADSQPRMLTTQLPTDSEPNHTDNAGAWEGIGELPTRLVPGAEVRLIMDQGYEVLYPGAGENKKDGYDSKARTDVVTLTGAVGTLAEASDPGDFGSQAVSTLSAPRKVTLTNTGSNPLHLGKVGTVDSDGASADDFLISADTCAATTLAQDETCTVTVRFAPAREDAASVAQLRIASDVPAKATVVALTGSSTKAPTSGPTPEVIAGTLAILGTATVDQTMLVVPSGWSVGASFAYQWLADGTPIPGATNAQYTPTASDAGKTLTVSVTGSLAGATNVSRVSDPVRVATAQLTAATPVISGVAQVDQTVTAAAGIWTDATSLSYRWLRNGKAIATATAASYRLTAEDAGTILVVEVTGTKPGYDPQLRNSTPVFVSEGSLTANSPVSAPTINGLARPDHVVRVNAGAWPTGVQLSYRWLRDGRPIAGATAASYRVSGSDAGHGLSAQVFANKTGYTTVIATSPIAVVAKGTLSSSRPRISGTAKVGKKLTVKPGRWSTGVRFSYRWRANGKNIAKATRATLTLTTKLRGKKISVTVIATKTGYNTVSTTSKATKKVRR